ncbi:MAG TPA: alpha/beta hydrolase [Armatimonadota bacterium]|nr:alpha/beta hydrolase [Armatimonadota bacterium]
MPPPHPPRDPSRGQRVGALLASVRRIGLLFLVVYSVLVVVLFFVQARLIFVGRGGQGRVGAEMEPEPGVETVCFTMATGEQVVARFGVALTEGGRLSPHAAQRPTLLLFYGNGGQLRQMTETFQDLRRLGFNVLIPDYVGYGMSSGKASEAGCYATADAAYEHLVARKDVDSAKIVAAGYSLGGGVAIDLAARRPVAGLAVFNTFTSLTAMAGRQFPYIPVSLLLRHRFESDRKIARVRCPILIASGTADTLVPPAMSDRLASLAQSPVTRLQVEGAEHNELFWTRADEVFPALQRFVSQL